MSAVLQQPNLYLADFAALPRTGLEWLDRLREEGIRRFSELGFPTTRDEEWRFTNVAPVARVPFRPASGPAAVDPALLDRMLFPGGCRLVFVNGRYASKLSSAREALPGGVYAGGLAEALRGGDPTLELHLARHAPFQNQPFVALNTAFLEDGAYVQVPKGVVVEQPVHLVFVTTASGDPAVAHPRNLIVAGAHSQLTVTETYIGLGDQAYFTNAVTEIAAGEDAVVDHYKLQFEREQAFHIASLHADQARGSNFSSHSISLGGALVRSDANIVLSEGSEGTLNGLYLAGGTQHVDHHTAIDHAEPHADSHELYKGILDGHASAVFNGKIIVRKDAQKTDSKQTNKNLVLSEDAVINTKPELQIWADDVRCTHGATIGQLDAEALFYLQSRGIGRENARDLLIYAFARDIIDRVKVASMHDRLERLLFEKLHEQRH
jgi:Fe-S cluster assembly protein SufD